MMFQVFLIFSVFVFSKVLKFKRFDLLVLALYIWRCERDQSFKADFLVFLLYAFAFERLLS